jgi:cytochrome c oxidase subunit 3
MWLALASIAMMFMAFTSAYVIRMGDDWAPISIPSALWLSTGVLLTSSFTIELARKALKRGLGDLFKRWLWVTTFLGIAFLVGQLLAWRQLAVKGIYLSTNPHSSFFYVLTSFHGMHLLGGVFALFWIVFGAWRNRFAPERTTAVDVTALYWHFMDVLWIYLFLLLFVWRQ